MIVSLALLMVQGGEVDLGQWVRKRGLTIDVDPVTGIRRIENVSILPGARVALVDGQPVLLSSEVRVVEGRVLAPRPLVERIRRPERRSGSEPRPRIEVHSKRLRPGFRVCVDPGHGGAFDGATGASGRVKEKQLTLSIALKAAKMLEAAGAEVVLTRRSDHHLAARLYEDLQARVDLAERKRCDVFVSIHLNWCPRPSVRGFEIYVPRSGAHVSESIDLAGRLRGRLRESVPWPDRGIKKAGFYVLRKSKRPAVLLELEFLSNPDGERDMMRENVQQRVARAIAEALVEYAKALGH